MKKIFVVMSVFLWPGNLLTGQDQTVATGSDAFLNFLNTVEKPKVSDWDVAYKLIERGALVVDDDIMHKSPLHHAIELGAPARVVEAMLQHGAKKDVGRIEWRFGTTAFHEACRRRRSDIIELFLSCGGGLTTFSRNGDSPFSHMIYQSIYLDDDLTDLDKCVATFIRYGFDINKHSIFDERWGSPFLSVFYAVELQNCFLRKCLEWGADLNCLAGQHNGPSGIRVTPLHHASFIAGSRAGLLLELGADVEVRDEKGKTVLDYVGQPELCWPEAIEICRGAHILARGIDQQFFDWVEKRLKDCEHKKDFFKRLMFWGLCAEKRQCPGAYSRAYLASKRYSAEVDLGFHRMHRESFLLVHWIGMNNWLTVDGCMRSLKKHSFVDLKIITK